MTKLNSNQIGRPAARASRGFTLIELLVVITILTVISAILIPRIRVINEDRNIREAARIVASAFAKASARAINDGSAGLMIVPNPNFTGPTSGNTNSPFYAGTRIFQMRRLPAYVGDDLNAMATITGGTTVTIRTPIEHDSGATPPRLIIQVNDEISLNNSSYRYRITGVSSASATTLALTVDTGSAPNLQSAGSPMVPFVIHRQPRRLESSLVELPDGYLIDLRYSGPLLNSNTQLGTHLNQDQVVAAGDRPANVQLHFDANGGVSRMIFEAPDLQTIQPTGSLNWLVTNFDPNSIDPATGAPLDAADDPIARSNNKWVTVDHITGSVNVASAVPVVPAGDVAAAIFDSQDIVRNRQSASQ